MSTRPDLSALWGSHDPQVIGAAYAHDAVRIEYALPGARLEGRAAIAAHAAAYVHAVPDCAVEVRHVAECAGGGLTVEWTFTGTHLRDLPGLPARGEQVALDGVSVCRLTDELIAEERVYWDAATLLAAAGELG